MIACHSGLDNNFSIRKEREKIIIYVNEDLKTKCL